MKALIPSLVFMLVLTASCGDKQHHELLVEAESFREKGGWLVDPQFTEQMGSAYLLAHGLGNPVENASTIVTIPASGKYHVWAVSYTHLRAHETVLDIVCRLLLEKKKK